jgi:hypothetical protein
MFERFTSNARAAVVGTQDAARRLGHPYVGTEHLLLGLLAVGDGIAASVLRDVGIDAGTVEAEVLRIVGPGRGCGSGGGGSPVDGPGVDPDADALRVLGIDLDAVRAAAEAAFGPGALDWARVSVARAGRAGRGRRRISRRRRAGGRRGDRRCDVGPAVRGHIPFTPRAKKVLELSLREAIRLGHRSIGTEHVLLGLVREGEGLAAEILVLHGVDLGDLRQRVLAALDDAA